MLPFCNYHYITQSRTRTAAIELAYDLGIIAKELCVCPCVSKTLAGSAYRQKPALLSSGEGDRLKAGAMPSVNVAACAVGVAASNPAQVGFWARLGHISRCETRERILNAANHDAKALTSVSCAKE